LEIRDQKDKNDGRFPYEKPKAVFVALRPEERLMSCIKATAACAQPKKFT
jgi:hypothetical protein